MNKKIIIGSIVLFFVIIIFGNVLIWNKLSVNEMNSGIKGTVLLGPTCPVQRIPPDPACTDKPYQGNLEVTTADLSRSIEQFSSNVYGKFYIAIPPGQYAIRSAASANMLPRCSSNGTITVVANQFVEVTVNCDTGIR